ncbi:MAG: hypothetical protein NZM26_04595 [Patescibacteria group bacterium]|nr:hypothetical protein [Patescibacteria group bacterium]
MYPQQDYIPPPPTKTKNKSKIKLIFLIVAMIFLTNLIVGFSGFMYGRIIFQNTNQKDSAEQNLPSISDALTPTPSPTQHITSTPVTKSPISNLTRERSIILNIENSLSGNVESSSSSANIKKNIIVGETESGFSRGFLTFDITKIPARARVNSAVIRFDLNYENFPSQYGKLYIDHLTYGDSLDPSDYALSSLVSNISQVKIEKNKAEADITKVLANDVDNSRAKSQIRIHYEIEKKFANSISSNLQIPKQTIYLEVKYTLPKVSE